MNRTRYVIDTPNGLLDRMFNSLTEARQYVKEFQPEMLESDMGHREKQLVTAANSRPVRILKVDLVEKP